MDISNLNIQIRIKTQFLSPNVVYGAYLVLKFCDPRKSSSKLMYVSLKYQMGSETRYSYFATCADDGWMMIELCRFIPHKKDVEFEVLLESLSRYYCGSGAIYVEGIKFQAINEETMKVREVDEKLNGVPRFLKSNSDSAQQVFVDYEEITQLVDGEKLLSSSKADDKKWHMLPAKMVLHDTSDVNRFDWKSLAESRFQEAVEVLSHQVLRIKCKIGAQKLSADTDYECYLVFKLSQQCDGLHCPVKVQDVLPWKKKEFKFLYFRSPSVVNFHGNERVPKLREDGLLEVILWEFNSSNKSDDDHVPMSLKLRCYEGTMSGLIVYGIEFRPICLPRNYKEIIQMSKNPEIYSNVSKKDLYRMFTQGIVLEDDKVCLSVGSNGERNEMISATTFSYDNNRLDKWISIKKSRFQRVLKITDISNIKTQIKIETQFLSPNVIYGAYLLFRFCHPRKFSNQPVYVNLEYKLGSETLHAYFATWREDEWLMIELCRLIPPRKNVDFEVLLESMSRYYCGGGAIYVEGIHFRAITNATMKLFSLSKAKEKKCHMLPAKTVLYDSSDVKCFKWKSLVEPESSTRDASMGRRNFLHNTYERVFHVVRRKVYFEEVPEFLSHQEFQLKCEIETQKLSLDYTNYACYLVFKLSQKCRGLHCPVKVKDVLGNNKEFKFLYFRSPRFVHIQGNAWVPTHTEDGLMEVIVWQFNSGNKLSDGYVPMNLRLRCYEGNMAGLIVYGIEFRPI